MTISDEIIQQVADGALELEVTLKAKVTVLASSNAHGACYLLQLGVEDFASPTWRRVWVNADEIVKVSLSGAIKETPRGEAG